MSLPVLAVAAEVGTRRAAMCMGSPQPQMPRARTSWDLRDLQPRSWIAESPLARSYSNFPMDEYGSPLSEPPSSEWRSQSPTMMHVWSCSETNIARRCERRVSQSADKRCRPLCRKALEDVPIDTDAGPSSAPLCKRHWRYEVEKGRVPRKEVAQFLKLKGKRVSWKNLQSKDGEQEKSPQISSKAEKNEAKQRKKNSPGLPALWKEDFPYQIAMNSLNDSPRGKIVERLGKKPKYMGDAGIFSQPGPPSDLDDLCCDEGELLGSLVRQPDGSYIWVSENGRQS